MFPRLYPQAVKVVLEKALGPKEVSMGADYSSEGALLRILDDGFSAR